MTQSKSQLRRGLATTAADAHPLTRSLPPSLSYYIELLGPGSGIPLDGIGALLTGLNSLTGDALFQVLLVRVKRFRDASSKRLTLLSAFAISFISSSFSLLILTGYRQALNRSDPSDHSVHSRGRTDHLQARGRGAHQSSHRRHHQLWNQHAQHAQVWTSDSAYRCVVVVLCGFSLGYQRVCRIRRK